MKTNIIQLHTKPEEKFSVPLFLVTITLSIGLFSGILWVCSSWLAPNIWETQIHSQWWKYVTLFFAIGLTNCFTEWFFHRYMLHAPLIPWLTHLFVQHNDKHHMLTNVFVLRKGGTQKWRNNLPIVEDKQHPASFFPWFTHAGFTLALSPLIGLAQWLLPEWPIALMGILTIAYGLTVYEIVHMTQHWPESTWKKLINKHGRKAEVVYAYHGTHHAFMAHVNENISGFVCGLPLADWVMGTLKIPTIVFLDDAVVLDCDLDIKPPRFAIIRWLDKKAEESIERYRKKVAANRVLMSKAA